MEICQIFIFKINLRLIQIVCPCAVGGAAVSVPCLPFRHLNKIDNGIGNGGTSKQWSSGEKEWDDHRYIVFVPTTRRENIIRINEYGNLPSTILFIKKMFLTHFFSFYCSHHIEYS